MFCGCFAGFSHQEDREASGLSRFDFPFDVIAGHHRRVFRPAQLRQNFRIVGDRLFGEVERLVGSYQRKRIFLRRQAGEAQAVLDGFQREEGIGGNHHPMALRERPVHQADGLRDGLRQSAQAWEGFIVEAVNRRLERGPVQAEFGEEMGVENFP